MEEYLNKQTSINDRAEERNIISGISKRQFFNTMKENEIDFEEVILKIKSGNAHFHKFNYLVRNLKSENNLNLIKCAIYLYQDFFDIKDTLECFDEDNMHGLRCELETKYGLEPSDKSSILKHFLQKISK